VNALERGISILEILARSEQPLGVTEIGAQIGVDKSSVHRLLATMTAHGFTEQDRDTRRYRLGTKIVELGHLATAKVRLVDEARPFVRELALRAGHSAHLAVMRDYRVVYLDEAVPHSGLRVDVPVGGLAPAYCTALGKALLSPLDDRDLSQFVAAVGLAPYTPNTIVNHDGLYQTLAEVRQRGYALDDEEFHEGVLCIAAPVRDHTATVVAALGISGPKQQVAAAGVDGLAATVVAIAGRLSRRLGFTRI
jgi:DNA-binding IclR family transcriptional regulator